MNIFNSNYCSWHWKRRVPFVKKIKTKTSIELHEGPRRYLAMHRGTYLQLLGPVLSVAPLLVLEVPQSLVVSFDLFTQERVLLRRLLLVELDATDAVQSFQIDPAPPSHADAVHYEERFYVDLERRNEIKLILTGRITTNFSHHPPTFCRARCS